MAITATNLTLAEGFGWAVNATTADASGCEQIRAAPGAGKYLVIKRVTVICDANITITIGGGETTGAVTSPIMGPMPYGANTGNETDFIFHPPIQLAANTALTVDASGAGNICVLVQGETK